MHDTMAALAARPQQYMSSCRHVLFCSSNEVEAAYRPVLGINSVQHKRAQRQWHQDAQTCSVIQYIRFGSI